MGPTNFIIFIPLFDVRMVLPVPPDSETEGTASLAGLDPATMYHSHSPGAWAAYSHRYSTIVTDANSHNNVM